MSDQVENQETTQAEQAPSLTLADLTLALQTIQVVAQRGAVRADEMSAVGGLYDRLFKFLDAQGAIQRAPAEPQTSEPTGE
jgi:hypothetical protein